MSTVPVPAPGVIGEISGWRSLTLENDFLRVVMLPDKGGDIYQIVDLVSGVDVLFKSPWGLQRPGSPPREGSGGDAFLENYEGGWQALLPNTNDECVVDGIRFPFHGEVVTRSWSFTLFESQEERGVHFEVDCTLVPLTLRRTVRLDRLSKEVRVEETVINTGSEVVRFVWGHHLVLGAPLVGAGARLLVPAGNAQTPPRVWEETARLEPGQNSTWPMARLRTGGEVDLSLIPGPEAGSHDDVYLSELAAGRAAVWNPELSLGFRLDFDRHVYPWLIAWQPYGGANEFPLKGSYALGVEPWVSGGNLADAVANGTNLTLGAGESIRTELVASVVHTFAAAIDEKSRLTSDGGRQLT